MPGKRSAQRDRGASRCPGPARRQYSRPKRRGLCKLHQAFVTHLQEEGLARFLLRDVGAFHDFVDFERLLAQGGQDIVSIIQYGSSFSSASEKFQ